MPYRLVFADGSAQFLTGRVAITRQDNDLTKVSSVQADYTSSVQLPSDMATHKRLGLPHVGTSTSAVPYQGLACTLEAGGVEVLPGARLALDEYTPRTGYSGRLLAGNRSFYDRLVQADGTDKTLRELDLSAFDHDWTLAAVVAGAGHTSWQQGYVYDLYDRGLGVPPLPAVGSSRLFEAGYWPTAYARAVWEAIFLDAGVTWSGELPAIFDTALLPATQPYGYSEATRAAQELVAGYAPTDLPRRFTDEQDAVLPVRHTQPTKQDTDLRQGADVQFNAATFTRTITVPGYYDLKAEQAVHIYCNPVLPGEVSAALQVFVNGAAVGEPDQVRGGGILEATLTALAERQLLKPGDVVQARYKFDRWGSVGPFDESWDLLPAGRLTVQLLSDFPAGGRVHLADWLPGDLTQKDFVKAVVQLYGLTQTTDPYTGAVQFRRTAQVVDDPRLTGVDWSERRDGSQPAKRSWKLGDFARRNFFHWKSDEGNIAYAKALFEQAHAGLGWNEEAAKRAAQEYAAGYLDIGVTCAGVEPTKDVLTLPFAASPLGADGLLLIPYWKPKPGTDYAADLQTIQDAVTNGTYTEAEAIIERAKALTNDFDLQQPAPRLCYQLPGTTTRAVLLEDDQGSTQQVSMRLSYFVDRSQPEDLDFTRSLLPRYYPHLAAALVRPLVLRPYVRLTAAEVVDFDQLRAVFLEDEGAWFWVNKIDGWEEDTASTAVELVRL